ncbi:MAG: ArsA-related P-loop ATPase [Solirubrobacteraceae bacterium]
MELCELIDALDPAPSGVVMTMGKGGVGKTTLAAALALADRGHEVTLSATDPAAHLAGALVHAAPELRKRRSALAPRARALTSKASSDSR